MSKRTRRTVLQAVSTTGIAAIAGCGWNESESADVPIYIENQTDETHDVDVGIGMVDIPDDRDYNKIITVEPGEVVRAFQVHTTEFCILALVYDLTDSADGVAHVCFSPDGNSPGNEDRGIISMRDPSDFSEIGYVLALRTEPLTDNPSSSIEIKPIHHDPSDENSD